MPYRKAIFTPSGLLDPGIQRLRANPRVTGKYTFQHADLNTIKGIGGTLHSVGDFTGRLDRIEVHGIADVPDFSLDTANHPMPLHTQFSAIVDGTTGDTYLQPVNAKLGASEFSCQGAVVNIKGQGHTIDLDVDVPAGHIQDFLQLAVKTQPAVMTGVLAMKTKLHIRPGKESVTQKLGLKGTFGLKQIHFTNPEVQDKVDMLSLRAEGHPKEAKPGAEDVSSRMTGRFLMGDGKLTLQALVVHPARGNGSAAGCLHSGRKEVRFQRQSEDASQAIADGGLALEELGT